MLGIALSSTPSLKAARKPLPGRGDDSLEGLQQ